MSNMIQTTVYNHYLTTYAPSGTGKYDTHKKSDLRNIYNSIVKLNKDAPICLIDTSKETRSFAIGLKEEARSLHHAIASLSDVDENEMLNKRIAYSSNEDIASAVYIGDSSQSDTAPSFELEVQNLASSQLNMGSYLPSKSMELPEGAYSFDIGINDVSYEFQFQITKEDTNQSLQEKLSRLITNANIGVKAEVFEDGEGNSSLQISSLATGLPEDRDFIFRISDEHSSKSRGVVEYLGLGDITRKASNAEFTLNGSPRSAMSNSFTIDKTYELTLRGTSREEGDVSHIGLKKDTESLSENIHSLIGSYNEFLKNAHEYTAGSQTHGGSERLLREMKGIASLYTNELDAIGLSVNDDGSILVDNKQLTESAESDDARELFASVKDFSNSVMRKSRQIALNPMEYAHKVVVAYKNPGKGFTNPYITSQYSGMLFNSYC